MSATVIPHAFTMASLKKLSGVAHDIAHHAQSGLSYINPHLGIACHAAGLDTAGIDLLQRQPYPNNLPRFKPLELALEALHGKAGEILDCAGIPISVVHAIQLDISFPTTDDNYDCSAKVTITVENGRTFTQRVQ